jgi:anaphase-promoting complex subunit 2
LLGQTLRQLPGEHPLLRRTTPEPLLQPPAQPLLPSDSDQATYDRAWHVVTAHIALPSSATADDSFGTLAAGSQQQSLRGQDAEFHDAFALLVNARSLLPRATRTDDILAWHVRQVRAHFAQHVIPLLTGCVGEDEVDAEESGSDEEQDGDRWRTRRRGNYYEKHMVIVMSSIRTLEAALRLYFFGLNKLLSGFARLADASPEVAKDAELLNARFRRDLHAFVSNSASDGLTRSIKAVLVRLAGTILGIPSPDEAVAGGEQPRPAAPGPDDLKVQAARERLIELVQQLHNVGLAGERFQVLFAEVMDAMMSDFVTGAYAGLWSAPDLRSFSASMDTVSLGTPLSVASPCAMSLNDWVENHFARLAFEVLACISANPQGHLPVSLADLKTYQSLALGRLAALRIQELFDIVLAWPASLPALDDLRATITTAARRKQLTDSFSRALQTRLLHPGCSTLEILRTYISIIRTLHALDPSKVLLSHVEPGLQLYLCHREDAVRVVVSGLLASPEEIQATRSSQDNKQHVKDIASPTSHITPGPSTSLNRSKTTPSPKEAVPAHPTKLVELALLLNKPPSKQQHAHHQSQQSRRHRTSSSSSPPSPDRDANPDPELDWNDMSWLPDPIDAGANYRRPRSEDVIGTLISALGSEESFIKEFSSVMAERLLLPGGITAAASAPADSGGFEFEQELRVLRLLKRRFGEASLQGVDVMVRDVVESRGVDGRIHRHQLGGGGAVEMEMEYHARILSRLFWPGLDREHFLLPEVVVEQQKVYEAGYERLKSRRKLTWLNQMGQARVEIELRDRRVEVDCSTVEATVVYAFARTDEDDDTAPPVRKSVDELYEQLQMDEDLITAALQFWVTKGVLRRAAGAPNTYVVLETVDEPSAADTVTAAATTEPSGSTDQPMEEPEPAAAATAAAKPGLSAKERERREIYWRYIQGMLTNASASMPLAQMAMMMKMLIADGFPWSNEELQDFLGEKVLEGEMEVVGGKYRLVKK